MAEKPRGKTAQPGGRDKRRREQELRDKLREYAADRARIWDGLFPLIKSLALIEDKQCQLQAELDALTTPSKGGNS